MSSMRGTARNSSKSPVPAPTVTYKVSFGRNGNNNPNGKANLSGKIPRVTRLLALAHRIEGMIRSGELQDWTDAARLVGVTRARMTQIGNLLLLGPEIQEEILNLRSIVEGKDPIKEHDLRSVLTHADWDYQRSMWESLRPFCAEFTYSQFQHQVES